MIKGLLIGRFLTAPLTMPTTDDGVYSVPGVGATRKGKSLFSSPGSLDLEMYTEGFMIRGCGALTSPHVARFTESIRSQQSCA